MAVDGYGNAYAVWEDYRSSNWDIYYATLKAGESNWSANRKINDDATSNNQGRPQVASDRDGNLQVVWTDSRSGSWDIYRSKLAAGSAAWSPNDKINDGASMGNWFYSDIALDTNGAAVMVWNDSRGGIYSMRDAYTANVYTYDSLYRLKEAGSPGATTAYSYDSTGNRTVLTDTGRVLTYTYDAADRMTAVGTRSVTWDANGNMLTKDGVTYTYDSANRLTTIVSPTLVATFEYDADGLRTSATVNGVRTSYLWDVGLGLPVILSDTNSIYVYGLGLIARQTGSAVEYYHADALGSVRNLTNGSGQNSGAYSYKPFGEPLFDSAGSTNAFRYTGQQKDSYIKLYEMGARWYDQDQGRFLSPDSIIPDFNNPQSFNRYAYAFNNPLRYTDPSGHDPLDSEWEKEWAAAHPGQTLDDAARRDRLYSLIFAGRGEGGAWTSEDWADYTAQREGYWNGTAGPTQNASGVDSFSEHLNRLASWYKPGEEPAFAMAIGLVWGGIPYSIDGGLRAAHGPVYTALYEGHGNWNPKLIDEGENNQTHHYAGFLYVGFFYGEWSGYTVNRLRDYDNPPDIALGDVAVRHGVMLQQRVIRMKELSLAFQWAVDARPGIWPYNTPGVRSPRYAPR